MQCNVKTMHKQQYVPIGGGICSVLSLFYIPSSLLIGLKLSAFWIQGRVKVVHIIDPWCNTLMGQRIRFLYLYIHDIFFFGNVGNGNVFPTWRTEWLEFFPHFARASS